MRVVSFTKQNIGMVAIISAVAAMLCLGFAIRASGIRPYGEQEILEQIAHEDGALCEKFGFTARTAQSADCVLTLADLRQRHVDLLVSYSWL